MSQQNTPTSCKCIFPRSCCPTYPHTEGTLFPIERTLFLIKALISIYGPDYQMLRGFYDRSIVASYCIVLLHYWDILFVPLSSLIKFWKHCKNVQSLFTQSTLHRQWALSYFPWRKVSYVSNNYDDSALWASLHMVICML